MNRPLSIVPAGAGAGKTHHIQTRLTEWVKAKKVRPDRILAVTFTEAAAAELLGRIRESLLEEGMIEAAFDLERAYVSTIHSLGMRILTEHSFAAGLTPAPRQLQQAEQDILIRQTISQCAALEAVAADPERYGHAPSWDKGSEEGFRARVLEMIALLRGLGEAGMNPALATIACERIDEVWGHVMADPVPARDRLAGAVEAMLDAFPKGALHDDLKKGPAKDFRADLATLRHAQEVGRLDWDWATWNALRSLRQTKRGCPTPPGYDDLAAEVMTAAGAILTHPGPREDAKTNFTALIHGAQEIMQAYAERKRSLGVIDFNDMIVQAEAILRSRPDVLQAVLNEVDCVIIDEFQDTSPVQFALLWRLAERAPRTLLVGDVKQSIMGFQGADPRLSKALEAVHPEAVDPLPKNWRSDPRIMDFVNAIGPGLFGSGYHPLIPDRAETGHPAIEVIRLSASRGTKTAPKPPAHVAARIAAMLGGGEVVTDRKTGLHRPVEPADIAILCRRHKEAARYADALRALGLPVRIAAEGWLDAQVVMVARYALCLAADPSDAHAALVVLGFGPACLDPQTALTLLAEGTLLDHPALAPILALSGAANGVPVADLTLRVTALLRPWAESLPDPVQALADLAKLETLAADFDAAEPDTLSAAGLYGRGANVFLAWLEAQRDERDFDRHPDPGSDAAPGIEIVTWHASKGREWPVTVVCELDGVIAERPHTTRAVFDDFSDLSHVLDHARLIHTPKCVVPEIRDRFIADRQAAAEDEARNLIYVALTRARDRLILEWIDKALDDEKTTFLGLLARDAELSLDDGLKVGPRSFPAEVYRDPADTAPLPATTAARPYHRFGALAPEALAVSDLPFRRRPSLMQSGSPLPRALQTERIGTPHASGTAMSATERGTAWHQAFRTLALRPDLAHRLPAATGLPEATLAAISQQVEALRTWAGRLGCPDLLLELPIHVIHPDGTETLGIVDAVAVGPRGLLVIDHKTGKAPDPALRFASYWFQLSAYAEALEIAFPGKPVIGVAVHWMEEGTISLMPMEEAGQHVRI
ncbi:UvrD-helicase domain-containing protein [Paragemmobacter straminiformis]|uniref:DNA 3'-5' helicase n=1 Tax=Paragemmobacter straminiformis TaxID=2045119 RepID=A0A842I3F2_9RHOB|nr:UvrD-helicase domain-containing protein [Gemmobacter straminiformis]MBC2834065.1 UvrD-helicase domain-containing protein [Gemmobacter straminiformis]